MRPPPPPRCPRCQVPWGTGRPLAAPCLECTHWPGVLESARAVCVMEDPANSLVHALKYGGWRLLADAMGRRMAMLYPHPPSAGPVVPVPTTAGRSRLRGYNQAQALAEVVAEVWGVELVEALERTGRGSQVRSGPRDRARNVAGSFRADPSRSSPIQGADVILIDDVLTTGATALAAADALVQAGVRSIRLLTFARALPFSSGKREESVA